MVQPVTLTWHTQGQHVLYDEGAGGWRLGGSDPLPPRELVPIGDFGHFDHVPAHGASGPVHDGGNLLIQGDNLFALKALQPVFRQEVDLIYIDPPFNTGRDSAQYADSLDHGVWLSMFAERCALAKELVRHGGVFAAHLNTVEQPYARVLLDGLFGRDNLVSQVSWQRAPDRTLLGQGLSPLNDCLEYILIYSNGALRSDLPRAVKEEPMSWKTLRTYSRLIRMSQEREKVYEFTDSSGNNVAIYRHDWFSMEPAGVDNLRQAFYQSWRVMAPFFPLLSRLTNQQTESTFQQQLLSRMPDRDRLYSADFVQPRGKHKGKRTRYYLNKQVVLFLKDVAELRGNRVVRTADMSNLWTDDEVPSTGIAKEGGVALKRGKKPERLLSRLIRAFSKEGDLIMDFFAGSGTTGAVAHKLARRWIMVEASDRSFAMCRKRMEAVVTGADGRGVTRDAAWKGGGGFRILRVL